MFDFDYNIVKNGVPFVSVSSIGLAFNPAAIALLKSPQRVIVGFDRNSNVIGVSACSEGSELGTSVYDFAVRADRSGWVRLSMRDFMKYLALNTRMDFKTTKRFIAELDRETGSTLLIFIDDAHLMNGVKQTDVVKQGSDYHINEEEIPF